MVATNVSGETIGGESNADNMSSISAVEFIVCSVKSVPSSRFEPISAGRRDRWASCEGRSGSSPPGPSITGRKSVLFPKMPAVVSAWRSEAVLAVRRHAKVVFVPCVWAHAGTAATKLCHMASLRSGPKVGNVTVDSRIYHACVGH